MLTLALGFVSTSVVLLLGAALGLYFRVWVIIPATVVVILVSAILLKASPLEIWMGLVCILGLVAALQLGYLVGVAVGPVLRSRPLPRRGYQRTSQ